MDPLDRRAFLSVGGAGLVCTLAGHKLNPAEGEAHFAELTRTMPVPPKVRAAASSENAVVASGTNVREHWIRAEYAHRDIVPTHRDEMMGKRVRGRTRFRALVYRAYTPGFKKPLGPATIPGPRIVAEVGDTIVVHFENKSHGPVTMHPHGLFYTADMDGAYKGKYTDKGGFVLPNHRFTYIWEARDDSVGVWPYHDHGPLDPLPVFKGLFGPIHVRPKGVRPADREFDVFFHTLDPTVTGLPESFSCINGRAYAGNTPTFRAKAGQTVAWNVFALDNFFHTFHVHGHRWRDEAGRPLDNVILGTGDSIRVSWTEDNPGRWFYHCHVFAHLEMGMTGWYLVER